MDGTRTLLPLSAAVAPARAIHRSLLADLATWSLQAGTPVDLDLAALVLAASERRGGLLSGPLTRPGVNRLLNTDLFNFGSVNSTLIPEGVPQTMWVLLHFLHARSLLGQGSDPLAALLEPLQCYGGLDADGRPTPEPRFPDFPCQCDLPVRTHSRPGLSSWRLLGDTIIEIDRPSPAKPELAADYRPLARLNGVLRDVSYSRCLHVEDFRFIGVVDAGRDWPALWLYTATEWRGDVLVDERGNGYTVKLHGGRKLGYRFIPIDHSSAGSRSGAFWQNRGYPVVDRSDDESGWTEDTWEDEP